MVSQLYQLTYTGPKEKLKYQSTHTSLSDKDMFLMLRDGAIDTVVAIVFRSLAA